MFSGVCNCCVLWGLFVSVVFSGVSNCCVLWGLFVSVVFSGVYLYLSCSLGFVSVVFSGVYLYLSCSLGFVSVVFSGVYLYLSCNCCVLWGLFVSVVFSGVCNCCPFMNRLNRFWWVLIRVYLYTEPASVWHVFVLKDWILVVWKKNAWKLALKANLHAFTLPMELATPCLCIARYVVDCVMGP